MTGLAEFLPERHARQVTDCGLPLFPGSPVQWHLAAGVFDRTSCCGKPTAVVTERCRVCTGCGGAVMILAGPEAWLAAMFDLRWRWLALSRN